MTALRTLAIGLSTTLVTAWPQTRDARLADAGELHALGVAHHLERELQAASEAYDKALALDPPRRPTADEWTRIIRFAPRVFVQASEPFGLRDAAAILHPDTGVIAYHFFWDDDIDFPDDNDPCDHELIWVSPTPDGKQVERFHTYFHGRILEAGPKALTDAAAHGGKPAVHVQWGKHGSMPLGWESMTIVAEASETEAGFYPIDVRITLREYNLGTWRKLSTIGRRLPDNPLASLAGWPRTFTGSADDFVRFTKPVDVQGSLERGRRAVVSRWNSGPLNRWLIPYNFRPKTEWPDAPDGSAAPVAAR